MRLKTWHISVTIVCILSGVLFAINLRAGNRLDFNPVYQRNENLVKMIRSQEKNNHQLEAEIAQIRAKLEEYQKFDTEGHGRLQQLQQELSKAKREAGLTPLRGPGIVITLEDKKKEAEEALKSGISNTEPFLIHDDDLKSIVNDLKVGGAEAISVNGLRIVSTSDIKCVGSVIMVNARRLAPPYIIKAIGDPSSLEEQVRKGTYLVLEWGKFPVQLTRESSITIQPFTGSFNFKHAKVIVKEGVQ